MKKVFFSIKRYFYEADVILLLLALAATAYGIILVYSATLSFGSMRSVIVQAAAAAIGIIGMILLSRMDYETFDERWYIFLVLGIAAIGVTLMFGRAPTADSNNKNWINLGFVSVQPSELVKLAFIITFSHSLHKHREHLNEIPTLLRLLIHMGFFCGAIVVQGDMGSALVFLFIGVMMLFCAGLYIRCFLGGALLIGIAAPFLWNKFPSYMQKRILCGFNPEIDPRGYGFQAMQSKIAIGSGQVLGKGYTQGTQVQHELLPAKQTDFIFAVAGEEFGFIGSLLVIALLVGILLRVLLNSRSAKDGFGSLLCIGVCSMLFAQIFENLGMAMGFLPVVGITLPFFSYGGSSIVSVWWALGMVQSVYMHRRSNMFTPGL